MSNVFKVFTLQFLNRLGYTISKTSELDIRKKYQEEINHWKRSVREYQLWYEGSLSSLYGEDPPCGNEKIIDYNLQTNAILTWQKVHQRKKYLKYLSLDPDAFSGLSILDLGAGPHASALAFKDCEVYCLDPLIPEYYKIGFPFHLYDNRARLTYGYAEDMPFQDNFFDALISVNAIDHVDDFEKTAVEMDRVLKPGGKIRMHIHYHKPMPTEPLELNDERVTNAFSWCTGIRKIAETRDRIGGKLTNPGEVYALWSNF